MLSFMATVASGLLRNSTKHEACGEMSRNSQFICTASGLLTHTWRRGEVSHVSNLLCGDQSFVRMAKASTLITKLDLLGNAQSFIHLGNLLNYFEVFSVVGNAGIGNPNHREVSNLFGSYLSYLTDWSLARS